MLNTTIHKYDLIETIGKGTLIQHGKHNDRIYLLKLDTNDIPDIFKIMSELCHKNKYSKITCKVPKNMAPIFYSEGFILEAYIPKFYNSTEDVFFVSKFTNSDRILNIEKNHLITFCEILKKENKWILNKDEFEIRELTLSDTPQISKIYRKVFKTYPFPILEEEYIQKTIMDNVRYFGAEKNGKLAAISSSEIDYTSMNAEMTDFATDPKYTGNNLAFKLLTFMENRMKEANIKTLYTIARLKSSPMNITFIRADYKFSGTLMKNTNISGDIESMNVYYKHL